MKKEKTNKQTNKQMDCGNQAILLLIAWELQSLWHKLIDFF